MSLNGYTGFARNPPCSDPACSEGMPHHDTVLLIYVFSVFGLVLIAMLSCFYACHLYTQRCERRQSLNPPPATQVIDSPLVPMKQAIFIEQPDGHSDVAWAITTAVSSQPLVDSAQKDKVFAALVQPINGSSSSQVPLTADQQSQSPQSHAASSPLLPHSR